MSEIIGNATYEQLYPNQGVSYTHRMIGFRKDQPRWSATVDGWKIDIDQMPSGSYYWTVLNFDRADGRVVGEADTLDEAKVAAEAIVAEGVVETDEWVATDPDSYVSVEGKGRALNVEHKPVAPFVSPRMEDNEPSFF